MKFNRIFAIALAASGAVACGDSTAPGPTSPITMNLCTGLGSFGWVAYKNDGGAWTQATADLTGAVTFDATEKVSVAVGFSFFGASLTQVVNATATELNGSSDVGCETGFGSRTISGTVAGVTGDQYAIISAATSTANVDQFGLNWTLEDLPATAVDIVASRYPSYFVQPADRVLVRRGITQGGSLAALDFNGSESGAPESATVTVTGLPSSGSLLVSSSLLTANGTLQELGEMSTSGSLPASQAVSYLSLPSSLRISTDQHILSASVVDFIGDREILHYYKTPGSWTFAIGPALSVPVASNASTAPYIRPRLQIASQAEYPGAMMAQWTYFGENGGSVAVMTTAGYLGGTPQTWDLEFPDMSSANYNAAWAPHSTDYQWSASGFSAINAALVTSVEAANGTTILSATRSSDGSTVAARRKRGLLRPPAIR